MVVGRPSDIDLEKQEWLLWTPIFQQLRSSFRTEPIEDCASHPAELIVQQQAAALGMIRPEQLVGWLVAEDGEFAASVITCLGRCDVPVTDYWSQRGVAFHQSGILASTTVGDAADSAVLQPALSDDPVSWRLSLIKAALKSHDVRVRDSAVQAVENWSSEALLAAFDSHDEPEPWLRDYIVGVRDDLST